MKRVFGPSRRARRGFTLVELMVAMVAGMLVAISVFTLAKHSSSFAMRQSRLADATLQSVIGFERLKADIGRAGFLTTPNVIRDPAICRDSLDPLYPAWMSRMASVFIDPVPVAQLSTESTGNSLAPNRITLTGSYDSPDLFVARNISETSPPVVYLSRTSLGMANINYTPATGVQALGRVFRAGRALRILDDAGGVQFGTIASVAGGENPNITLSTAPGLLFRGRTSLGCGIRGHGNDFVNVVNIVRYDMRDLRSESESDPLLKPMAGMFRGGPTYENTRRELIREELDVTGEPIDGTLEMIAEYAVDLGFSLFVAPDTSSQLQRITPANVGNYAGDPTTLGAGTGPQLIRAVHAWLSVRSQEADRPAAIPMSTTAPGPDTLRVLVNPGDVPRSFARVRTLQSTIPLNNQMRATWE